MKKLAFAALLLAGLAQATGCIFVSDDEGGQFEVRWALLAGSTPTTCEAVGADYVASLATLNETGEGFEDLFHNCSAGTGTTFSMPLGTYTVDVSIWDDVNMDTTASGGDIINAADDIQMNLQDVVYNSSLDVDGDTVQLPVTTYVFAPQTANIDFSVDFGAAGGTNCTSPPGVVQMDIQLYDAGGSQCLSVTLSGITDAGGAPTTDTLCDTTYPLCEETNVIMTLDNLDPGDYELEIWGLKGAVGPDLYPCYSSGPIAFTVLPGTDDDLGAIAAPFDESMFPVECNATKPLPPLR